MTYIEGIRDRPPRGWAITLGRGRYRMSGESWVVSAAVDALLGLGYQPETMFVELTVAQGSRPDLVVVCRDLVIIFEAKVRQPTNADRLQVRRYMDAAGRRWDRHVTAFLVWPDDKSKPWPYAEADLRLEAVA